MLVACYAQSWWSLFTAGVSLVLCFYYCVENMLTTTVLAVLGKPERPRYLQAILFRFSVYPRGVWSETFHSNCIKALNDDCCLLLQSIRFSCKFWMYIYLLCLCMSFCESSFTLLVRVNYGCCHFCLASGRATANAIQSVFLTRFAVHVEWCSASSSETNPCIHLTVLMVWCTLSCTVLD